MCLSPLSKAAAARSAEADKDASDASTRASSVQEDPNDAEERVLTAGLFPPEDADEPEKYHGVADTRPVQDAPVAAPPPPEQQTTHAESACVEEEKPQDVFTRDETFFVFDYDDTLLPSTWLQRQKLRLDCGSVVSEWQREQLKGVETTAIELLRNAKQHGNVILVTNAERGWIELSCQKFLPGLLPLLEDVKAVSARTTFESREVSSPLEWKLRAFEREISTFFGQEKLVCPYTKKNILSLGDAVHEREALLRATQSLPNCSPKSLKFVERPDISQIIKQHSLVINCFHRIVHQEGLLDLCIKCT